MNAGIDAAFRDGTPRDLRLRLPARLALAQALELITKEFAAAIQAVAKVRHRLAHGGDDVVTTDELSALRTAVAPLVSDDLDFTEWSEDDQLRIIIATVWQATGFTIDHALQERDEMEVAFTAWRSRHTLSKEQVADLLRSESVSTQSLDEEIIRDLTD